LGFDAKRPLLVGPVETFNSLSLEFLAFVASSLAAISVDHNANGPGPECVKE
jgi:hypothetical protein